MSSTSSANSPIRVATTPRTNATPKARPSEQIRETPILEFEKTLRISPEKYRLFKTSLKGASIKPIGMRTATKWYPVSKIATPEFTVNCYNTRGEMKPLRLEAWICLDRDDDGNYSILPMLIDNWNKEEAGTGSAVCGTHPDFRMAYWPSSPFVFFYGGAKIVLTIKEKEK